MTVNLLLVISFLVSRNVVGGVTITVTGNEGSLTGKVCPGIVDIECSGENLAFLQWRVTASNGGGTTNIVTLTTTNQVNVPLSIDHPAFISAKLTSKLENPQDQRFADFTSILTANISQLSMQRITEIQCGDSVRTATERVNVTVIEESPPEDPIITNITVTYQDQTTRIEAFWQAESVDCPQFRSSLHHMVSLAVLGQPIQTSQVSSESCGDTCLAVFDVPDDMLSSSFVVTIATVNAVGMASSSTGPIGLQSSQYLSLSVQSEECITFVQCQSFSGGDCTLSYKRASDTSSDGQPVPGTNATLRSLSSNTAHTFSATTVINGNVRVTEMMNFTTGEENRLTTSNIVSIALGAIFDILSIVFLCVEFGITLAICGNKFKDLPGTKKCTVCFTICLVVNFILELVCIALWIAVGCVVGLQDDTCNLEWQQTRDALTWSAFGVSVVTFVFGCADTGAECYCYRKIRNDYIVQEKKRLAAEAEAEANQPKGFRKTVSNTVSYLASFLPSRSKSTEQNVELKNVKKDSKTK